MDDLGFIESLRIPDQDHNNEVAGLARTIRKHSLDADERMIMESEEQEAVDAFNQLVKLAKANDELIYERL